MENEALRLETEKLRHSLLAVGGFAHKQLTVDEAPSVSASIP
jgi:regulator of replication initiation timing